MGNLFKKMFCLQKIKNISLKFKIKDFLKVYIFLSLKYKSKNIFHASSCLYNDKGEEIAFGSGSFCKSKITLSSSIGYI